MASKSTFQNIESFTVNREGFYNKVVLNEELSKKDIRVLLHLMLHLDGKAFKSVSEKNIGKELGYKKNEVLQCIHNLIVYDVIEEGSTGSVSDGYRLCF